MMNMLSGFDLTVATMFHRVLFYFRGAKTKIK